MSHQTIWLIIGAVLVVLETVIPGGVVIFLGLSALVVAALMYFNVVVTLHMALITWFISSVVMLLALRSFFMKYFEGGSYKENVDEDLDSLGSEVEVIESIQFNKVGRVRFRETTWEARSDEELEVGVSAIIIGRDGNKWIVRSK